ncbi:MAG: hypothetical protein ABF504_04705 [Komagataeibacter saccharivorans]|uniref:hypothetical protein n=1 Tax=Komagataeibacter saccharivorans TaxID=265959 RepID=UPI0039E81E74
MRLIAGICLVLGLASSLAGCADQNPRMDRNARAAYDRGGGGYHDGWAGSGGGGGPGGWGGPGGMGW